ncbi:hypothetical protein COV19_00740 [Candidatus Woesearchaeota archaeon CG10_big_fil_rev_8_21_14_0_10_44_13]|nr:MAG: hypothetical protein COV19_00740 [Candidatus Woesearchaeota archaeon CG10_big_fil_rev_8_21_14_0_10_44_13]
MVKRFIRKFRTKELSTWIDKLTFFRIFVLWTSAVVIFGLLFFVFSGESSYLVYSQSNEHVSTMVDSIYFSFVTATTTGFGDVVPVGFFKIMSVFEVVFGLILLAFVTSKIVSIKQDVILNEVYDISFSEKINRMRASLLLLRQNINKVIDKAETNSIKKREASEIYTYISSFEDMLTEIMGLIGTPEKHQFKKVVDPLETELIFNSVLQTFERFNELMQTLDKQGFEWRREVTISVVHRCLELNKELFDRLNSSKSLPEKKIADLNVQKNKAVDMIKIALSHKNKPLQRKLL